MVGALVGPEGGTVTSPDGSLTLTIPPGALSEDKRIGITRINTSDLPPEFEGLDPTNSYDLQPDGLQFNLPIDVEILTDQEALDQQGNIAVITSLLFTSLNGELELLSNLETNVNADDNTVLVKGTLEHFSTLVKRRGNVKIIIENVPRVVGINIPFTIDVIVDQLEFFGLIGTFVADAFYTDKSTPDIFPFGELDFVFEVIPRFFSPEGIIFENRVFKTSFDYICLSSERASGTFIAQIDIFGETTVPSPVNRIFPEHYDVIFAERIFCRAEPGDFPDFAPTPTPPPPPLPTLISPPPPFPPVPILPAGPDLQNPQNPQQ